MQADCFAASCAAISNQATLDINNTHIWRTIRDSPVGCRRHFGCEVNEHARKSDAAPKTQHEAPVEGAANKAEKATTLFGRAARTAGLAIFRWFAFALRTGHALLLVDAKHVLFLFLRFAEGRFDTSVSAVSRCHVVLDPPTC